MTMKITKAAVMLYAAFYTVCLKSILEEVCHGDAYRNPSDEDYYEVDGGRKRFGKA